MILCSLSWSYKEKVVNVNLLFIQLLYTYSQGDSPYFCVKRNNLCVYKNEVSLTYKVKESLTGIKYIILLVPETSFFCLRNVTWKMRRIKDTSVQHFFYSSLSINF